MASQLPLFPDFVSNVYKNQMKMRIVSATKCLLFFMVDVPIDVFYDVLLTSLWRLKNLFVCFCFLTMPSDPLKVLIFVGTDTIGCVRIPASFCGILGFRPSHGAVSMIGVLRNSQSLDTVGMENN